MRNVRPWFHAFAVLILLSACSSDGRSPDRTPPSITLMGDNPQVLAVGVAYVEMGATASDNRDGDISGSIVINSSSVDSSAPGEYTVTYNVSDAAGNAAVSVNRTVIYEDQTPPDLTLTGENPQIIEAGAEYNELGASAIDNVDGNLTAAISVDASAVDTMVPGEYAVDYEVSDAAGNSSTISRVVRVQDTMPPVLTLLGDDPQTIIIGNPYAEQGASAVDDVEGDLSAAVVIDSSAVDVLVVGSYQVVYSVADSAGNSRTVSRTVRVENPPPPAAPTISVTGETKQLIFSWDEAANADYYRLLENPDGHSGYTQVGEDMPEGTTTTRIDIAVHLHDWTNGLYMLEACNPGGCASSTELSAQDAMLEAIGYFKASNRSRKFGFSVAVSGDGSTLAVGAIDESSGATGINGDQSDNSAPGSGAVYLFRFDGSSWSQTDYIKASNTGRFGFGRSVALDFNGSTLAVGATGESSGATGINGDQSDGSAGRSGAVYLFRLDADSWQQQAYIKASNTDVDDLFGGAVSLSADGNTLAAGAFWEDGSATGINGDDSDNSLSSSGAVYLFRFVGTTWSQQAYIKASNTGFGDQFGVSLDLSADGNTLAVGARFESSQATGINGDQDDRVSLKNFGAAYLFRFDGIDWYQQAYIKASNTGQSDRFGDSITLSADGNTLAVGAPAEGSSATGINGNQDDDNLGSGSGAVYVFRFDGINWSQQAYIKASNTGTSESFGIVELNADGDKLAVGAPYEDSIAAGVGGDQFDDHPIGSSGAVYLFELDGATWQQTAYIKAPNPGSGKRTPACELDPRPWLCEQPGDSFGAALSLSADGHTLAVGSQWEDSSALGVGGDQTDSSAADTGAVYIY